MIPSEVGKICRVKTVSRRCGTYNARHHWLYLRCYIGVIRLVKVWMEIRDDVMNNYIFKNCRWHSWTVSRSLLYGKRRSGTEKVGLPSLSLLCHGVFFTTSDLEKLMFAMLEFYFSFRFRHYHRNRHCISLPNCHIGRGGSTLGPGGGHSRQMLTRPPNILVPTAKIRIVKI